VPKTGLNHGDNRGDADEAARLIHREVLSGDGIACEGRAEDDARAVARSRRAGLHDAVAAKLEAQPELLDVARANLQRWLCLNPAPALHEWAHLLDSLSVPALVGLLRSGDERATRLRQSSPFAGFLTAQERQAILNDYESRRT